LVSTSTGNLDSYQQYLRARALFRARNVEQTIAILEPVVARDPTYAPAWGLLGLAYGWTVLRNPIVETGSVEEARQAVRTAVDKAESAAREAIRLDPSHAGGYIALAFNEDDDRGRFAESEDLRLKALSLDPGEPESLDRYAFLLARVGRSQQALRIKEQLKTLEPFVPAYNASYAGLLVNVGEINSAIAILEGITGDTSVGNTSVNVELARAYAAEGRYADAADKLLEMARTAAGDADRPEIEEAARLLRSAPAALSLPERVPLRRGVFMFVYAHVGAFDRILELAERSQQISPGGGINIDFWSEAFAPLRKTERFKALARRSGLVDYWRERGWPDLCRPVGADDFECD
jgi:tetratricopeptide (TPR) repeat protein